MHTASYEFLMKPKESAGCHQTLSVWVGSGGETTSKADSTVCVNYDYATVSNTAVVH